MTSSEWPSPLARAVSHAAWAAFGWVLWTGVRVAVWRLRWCWAVARRYVCDVPQPDGVDRPGCVRAIDCDCLDVYAEACGDFKRPRLCEDW